MIISLEKNRAFNALLKEAQPLISPQGTQKAFRQEIKFLDPSFPRDENNEKVSMRDITDEQFDKHLQFVKTMLIKQGNRLEYFTDLDVEIAKDTSYKASGHMYQDSLWVVCSCCGCATKRELSQDRMKELTAIMNGEIQETLDPLSKSFECLNCFTIKVEAQDGN